MESTEHNAYIVNGGIALKGEIDICGAKNAAIKLLIGALLFDGDVVIQNVPQILDVKNLLLLINSLGAKATFVSHDTVIVNKNNLNKQEVSLYYGSKIRSSFLLLAPLLYYFGNAMIPNPGGCKLGARSIDRIMDAVKMLHLDISYDKEKEYYQTHIGKKLPHGTCRFAKTSHTGTELMLLIAARSTESITIENASPEPEIDDLIRFLNEGGASIKRSSSSIHCQGVKRLEQKEPFTLMADRLVASTYAMAAIATKGWCIIRKMEHHIMKPVDRYLQHIGVDISYPSDTSIKYEYKQPLASLSVTTDVYPGFMTDIQPLWALLMTQAHGESIIHERLFENRFSYVEELLKLGANIRFLDIPVFNPDTYYYFNWDKNKKHKQAIYIQGPQKLRNGVVQMMDIRAGATVAIATLLCEGESVVHGIRHMERGYPNITKSLQNLGADIKQL